GRERRRDLADAARRRAPRPNARLGVVPPRQRHVAPHAGHVAGAAAGWLHRRRLRGRGRAAVALRAVRDGGRGGPEIDSLAGGAQRTKCSNLNSHIESTTPSASDKSCSKCALAFRTATQYAPARFAATTPTCESSKTMQRSGATPSFRAATMYASGSGFARA